MVTKEMYTFTDRGGDSITLRPEGTAGVARALISGGLAQHLPLKFFYAGPMFRYERPQKGRLRQFHQVGVESLGLATPLVDAETIAVGHAMLRALGVADAITLELNTLGDSASRDAYRDALVDYLRPFESELSADSRTRLSRNPLRILDSKDTGDQEIIAGAPDYGDYLNPASREFFAGVTSVLEELDIPYALNPRLVRGLDYYCHTAFEFTTDRLGSQGTVLAGGRYDGLVRSMGGPHAPGIGWAAGIERLAMLLGEAAAEKGPVVVVPLGDGLQTRGLALTNHLRDHGYRAEMGFSGNLKKRLARANRMNAAVALILGEDEAAQNAVTVRDLDTGEQKLVALSGIESALARYR